MVIGTYCIIPLILRIKWVHTTASTCDTIVYQHTMHVMGINFYIILEIECFQYYFNINYQIHCTYSCPISLSYLKKTFICTKMYFHIEIISRYLPKEIELLQKWNTILIFRKWGFQKKSDRLSRSDRDFSLQSAEWFL